jgi:hypothetical protein
MQVPLTWPRFDAVDSGLAAVLALLGTTDAGAKRGRDDYHSHDCLHLAGRIEQNKNILRVLSRQSKGIRIGIVQSGGGYETPYTSTCSSDALRFHRHG